MSHLEYGKQDLRLNEIDGVQIFIDKLLESEKQMEAIK